MVAITVISTAYLPPDEARMRCLDSVLEAGAASHVYIDASYQVPPRTATQNLYEAASAVPRDHVIALVDGDDWLSRPDALSEIASLYEDPECWLTYGSYRFADGRPGHAAAYGPTEDVRVTPWRATHLKTFRAALFAHLRPYEFKRDGGWLERCVDLATMFPLIELAGWDRCRFVARVNYVYNVANSWEWSASPAQLAEERAVERYLRSRPKRARLESL